MPLSGPSERILATGMFGSGKSYGYVKVIEYFILTDTPGRFFLLDSDYAAERNLEGVSGWESRVADIVQPDGWADWLKIGKWRQQASRGDWLVVDMIDRAWQEAQQNFSERAFGTSIDEWFLKAAKAGTMGAIAGEFGVNWGAINRIYDQFIQHVMRWPGSVYACTPADPISDREGDAEMKKLFGKYGVKPAGQKRLPYQFHSVLLFQQRRDDWVLNTVRDRGVRKQLTSKVVNDFVMDYLVDVGGWTL